MNHRPLYIFDLDGTLADLKHRRHFVDGTDARKDWDAFHAACVDDKPIEHILEIARILNNVMMYDVWVWSGRMSSVRKQTIAWLQKYGPIYPNDKFSGRTDHILKMRSVGNFIADDVLKESWLKAMDPVDRERLVMVFDDRDRVVKMWRRNGVPCAQVAEGDF